MIHSQLGPSVTSFASPRRSPSIQGYPFSQGQRQIKRAEGHPCVHIHKHWYNDVVTKIMCSTCNLKPVLPCKLQSKNLILACLGTGCVTANGHLIASTGPAPTKKKTKGKVRDPRLRFGEPMACIGLAELHSPQHRRFVLS